VPEQFCCFKWQDKKKDKKETLKFDYYPTFFFLPDIEKFDLGSMEIRFTNL